MARGWESKAVEAQQSEAGFARRERPAVDPETRARLEQAEGLRLALAQAQAELQAACRAAHRDMLRLRMDALRQALNRLTDGGRDPR